MRKRQRKANDGKKWLSRTKIECFGKDDRWIILSERSQDALKKNESGYKSTLADAPMMGKQWSEELKNAYCPWLQTFQTMMRLLLLI